MSPQCIVGQGTSAAAWASWPRLAALPAVEPASLVTVANRAVVIAPHPDDEVLGTGGLLARLGRLGRDIALIAVTDGTASHPGSPQWPPGRLAAVRPQESAGALRRLGLARVRVVRGAFPDGAVGNHEARLAQFLRRHLRRADVVFTTWRHDGHPDHEAVGRVAARVARAAGARLVEVPIWTWHWARPGDPRVPWQRAGKIALVPEILQMKLHAVSAYASQLEPDASTGSDAILPAHVLARLLRDYEVLLL